MDLPLHSKKRESRSLRKHGRRFQVLTVSNHFSLLTANLRRFTLGFGWFIQFCAGLSQIGFVQGLSSDMPPLRATNAIIKSLWPGRPPDLIITAIFRCSKSFLLILLAYSIVNCIAISRIRQAYKSGQVIHKSKTRSQRIRRRSSHRKKFCCSMAFATVFNVDKRIPDIFLESFDEHKPCSIICDNSANVHICNDKSMFSNLYPVSKNSMVATIGGDIDKPHLRGTVNWTWLDDTGDTHSFLVRDVFYFPQSPINILGITSFAQQLNDESTTGINTRWKNSTFYWKGGFERTLQHPISQLPEMVLVSPKSTPFANYTHRCNSVIDDTVLFHHSSCYSCTDDVTSPPPALITQE